MKILHTSDWHFGHLLYGYDRLGEHRSFVEQLINLTASEQPDAILVSGDIFDTGMPSVPAQQLYTEALIGLHNASPHTMTVITAGNHDSPSRLEVYRRVWAAHNVNVIGTLGRTHNGEIDWQRHILPVADKGYVVALPHIYQQNYPVAESADRLSAFYRNLQAKVEILNVNNLPIILMAHTAVHGCNLAGHRRMQEDSIGSIEYIDLETFGTVYDYIALGHIHHPQTLQGETTARYSGSPVAVSFDENYEHSVTIATIERGKKPKITTHVIDTQHPLLTIPSSPQPFEQALEALSNIDNNCEAYIRLNVLSNNGLPADYNERITLSITGKKCRYCTTNITRLETEHNELKQSTLTPDEFKQLNVGDVAKQYLDSKGIDLELQQRFIKMIAETGKKLSNED
ncbi:MAG: exonuclease subunit SbcD [Bacteroidales bacterium]|nr:exonuclease subunit SbcD [Bacteroidales bacterium]